MFTSIARLNHIQNHLYTVSFRSINVSPTLSLIRSIPQTTSLQHTRAFALSQKAAPNASGVAKTKTKSKSKATIPKPTISEAPPPPLEAVATQEIASEGWSAAWQLRFYKLKRLLLWIGIPSLIGFAGMQFHESDIPYRYAMKKLRNEKEKPAKWAQYLCMFWGSWAQSYNPHKIFGLWDEFMPLLDESYPEETRQVAIACLMGMIGGDASLPPHVTYQKALKKLEILGMGVGEDWPPSRFLQAVYDLCSSSDNPQMIQIGFELLLQLTQIPRKPREIDVQYVMERTGVDELMARSVLQIYLDPNFTADFIEERPPPKGTRPYLPKFDEIKRILVKHRALDFAFELMDHENPMFKNMAMMLMINLVGKYPDHDELLDACGDTPDERNQNMFKIVETLMQMGQNHYMQGENSEALTAFDECARYIPGNPNLGFFRCSCLTELGRTEEAIVETRLLVKNTRNTMPEALFQLAMIQLKHGNGADDWAEAATCLETLLDLGLLQHCTLRQIDLEQVYYRLQTALEKLKRFEDATTRMERLCEIIPNSPQAHFECGRMALMCNEYTLAEEHLSTASRLEPMDTHIRYQLAMAQYHISNYGDCDTNLSAVLNSRPNDKKALNLKMRLHMTQREWPQALSVVNELILLDPNSPYEHYQKAVILEQTKKNNDAIVEFQSAVDIWRQRCAMIGFAGLFGPRPNDRKALQKIQLRCERHKNDELWKPLCDSVFELGMMN